MLIFDAFIKAFKVCISPKKEWPAIKQQNIEESSQVFQETTFPLLFVVVFIMLGTLGISKQSIGMAIAGFALFTISHTLMVGITSKVLGIREESPNKIMLMQLVTYSSVPVWFCLPFIPFPNGLTASYTVFYALSVWLASVGYNLLFSEKEEKRTRFLSSFALGSLMIYGLSFLLLQALFRILF